MNPLQVAHSQQGGWAVITAEGEIDVASAPGLLEAVDDAAASSDRLLIDLSKVTFMDSTGLGVIVRARRTFEGKDALRVVVAEANVRKVFEVTGLDVVLSLFDTREAALAG